MNDLIKAFSIYNTCLFKKKVKKEIEYKLILTIDRELTQEELRECLRYLSETIEVSNG
jgi:hypothetical protein